MNADLNYRESKKVGREQSNEVQGEVHEYTIEKIERE